MMNGRNSFASRMQASRGVGGIGGMMQQRIIQAPRVPGYNNAQDTVISSRQTVASPAATASVTGAAEFDSVKPVALGKKPQVSAATAKSFVKYSGDIDLVDLKIKRLSSVRELYAQGLRQPRDINILPEKKLSEKKRATISKKSVEAAGVVAPTAEISAVAELSGITPESDGFKNVLYNGQGLAQSAKNIVVSERQEVLNAAALSVTPGEVANAYTDLDGAGGGLLRALAPGGAQSVNTQFEKAADSVETPEDDSRVALPAPVLFKRSGAKRK